MDPHYRVAVFGSAGLGEEHSEYRDVFRIARGPAELGFDEVTGGGPGLMQAANAGFKAAGRTGGHSIGLNIRLPHEQDLNPVLDIKREFERFNGRPAAGGCPWHPKTPRPHWERWCWESSGEPGSGTRCSATCSTSSQTP
ncbi:MAG: hypothetical protein SCH98_02120 [Deferrisomatales bacterium]|nr:hypothetical protein [Deferrisomatales bacterium]